MKTKLVETNYDYPRASEGTVRMAQPVVEAASEARVRMSDRDDPTLVPTDKRELMSWYLWDWCATFPENTQNLNSTRPEILHDPR